MGNYLEKQAFANTSLWKAIQRDIRYKSTKIVSYDGKTWSVGNIKIADTPDRANCIALLIRQVFHAISSYFSKNYKRQFAFSLKRFDQAIQSHVQTTRRVNRIRQSRLPPPEDPAKKLEEKLTALKESLRQEEEVLAKTEPSEILEQLNKKQEELLQEQNDIVEFLQLQNALKTISDKPFASLKRSFSFNSDEKKTQNKMNAIKEKHHWNEPISMTTREAIGTKIREIKEKLDKEALSYQEKLKKQTQTIESIKKEIEQLEKKAIELPPSTPVSNEPEELTLNQATETFLNALEHLSSSQFKTLFEAFFKNCKQQLGKDAVVSFIDNSDKSLTVKLNEVVWLYSLSYNKNHEPDHREEPIGGSLLIFGENDRMITFSKDKEKGLKLNGISLRACTPPLYRKFIGNWAEPKVDRLILFPTSYELIVVQKVKAIISFDKYVSRKGLFSNIQHAWGEEGEILISKENPLDFLKSKRKELHLTNPK